MVTLIQTYVPEAEEMSWDDAVRVAIDRDIQAADALTESVETVLNLEAAVEAAIDNIRGMADLLVVGEFTGFNN
jgi:uncharacterized membrane protein